ncbi:MAG: hypothetical protein M1816_001203 [Peltula sp. TS41687]|nr:MAG: hypothetical protein M1816_001203 [Peltula sp. TS41687]
MENNVNPSNASADSNASKQAKLIIPFDIFLYISCGSSPGKSPVHLAAARSLAQAMHDQSLHLVYGGGTVGLMGELARTLVSLSGPDAVQGIIPGPLMRYENVDVSENIYGPTTVVPDMHTRKLQMARAVIDGGAGGGFVAMSGGYGTLEELMEIVTWNMLGIHKRPVVLFNVEGYYDGLIQWVGNAVDAGFVREGNRNVLVEAKDAEGVIRALKEYQLAHDRLDLEWGNQ